MSSPAGATARVILERSIQLLACEFHVSTDIDAVIERLDRLRPSAIQDHPVSRRHRFEVWREVDSYHVREDERRLAAVGDLDEVTTLLNRRLHDLAFSGLTDFTKLHAGCARWHGQRLLVIGHKGAGKTTLMTRLLFEDCAVEGDEMVLLKDGQTVAYPRRFGIRQRTLTLIPRVGSLAPHLLGGSGADESGGFHVLAMDPAQLGFEWRITTGSVDLLFFLASRHEGPTRVTPCSTQLMAQRVMAQSAPPSRGAGARVRDIGALVRGAAAYEIALGDLDSAVSSMRECISNACAST